MRVLLVEDNPVSQKVAARMIEACGSEVVVAENGVQAMALLRENQFSVVLMDCQMPEKDGFQTTLELREFERSTGRLRTPVWALTGYASEEDQARCHEVEMDGYLCKPISKNELLAVLRQYATESSDG